MSLFLYAVAIDDISSIAVSLWCKSTGRDDKAAGNQPLLMDISPFAASGCGYIQKL